MTPILRALTALAAPAGPKSRLSVFYFHRVLEKPDPLLPYEPDADMFDRILGWIGSQFRVLDPMDACDRLYGGTLPSRPAVITFDDGYRDNYTVALPILQRHEMKAVFFVATGFLNGGMMFNDRVIEAIRRTGGDSISVSAADGSATSNLPLRDIAERRAAIGAILSTIKHLPPDERLRRVEALEFDTVEAAGARQGSGEPMMMNPEEVLGLCRAGMTIGGHTRTHPILATLDDASAEQEIFGGLADLTSITGESPLFFAYPNGRFGSDFDARHVAMLGASQIRCAFTTHPGVVTPSADRMMLPRFTPWDRRRFPFQARALLNLRSVDSLGAN